MERRDLLHQLLDQALAGNHRIARDVVDRLLRIELRALAARLVEDIDERGAEIEQPELEDGEQADRPGADDDDILLDDRGFDRGLKAHVVHGSSYA